MIMAELDCVRAVIVDMDTNYWDLQAAANKCEYASCEPENKWKK